MAERKEIIIPKKFKEKFGDKFPIWSFSKCSSLENCLYEYYLTRIEGIKDRTDNIYTVCGNMAHNILEDYYNGKIEYKDMIDIFEREFLAIEIADYKFSNDKDKNKSMRDNYKNNCMSFFKNHVPVDTKVSSELEIWIDVKGNVFMGYVDAIHKEGDIYVITDYKTSGLTDYQGAKKTKKAMQLLLYALGLHQKAIPLDRIKCRWNFLKYTKVDISYKTKKGEIKHKSTIAERTKWVKKIEKQLQKDVYTHYTWLEEWERDILVQKAVKNNNLEELDEEIRNNYVLSDAYEYVDVNEESIENMQNYLVDKIALVNSKGKEDDSDWTREDIGEKGDFYCATLCSVRKHCKYWKKYMEEYHNDENKVAVERNDIVNELDLLLEDL